MRAHRVIGRLAGLTALTLATVVLLAPGALAQQVNITPESSITPTNEVTPWVFQLAILTAVLGVLALVGIVLSYVRFAPKFYGRDRAPAVPLGARPALLSRPPMTARAPVGATRPFTRPAESAVAVAERPAPATSATTTAEAPAPAAEAPAAEAEAPAAEAEAPAAEAEAPAAEAEAPAPEAEAPAPEAQAPAPAAEAEPPAPAASHGGGAGMDQETFDRVLQEQLGKGVDRRVAEGRARAAAVVAGRKKAQG